MARRKETEEEWQQRTRPIRMSHAWMTVRARQLVDDSDLTNDETTTIVDYVYEQTLAHVFDVLKTCERRRTLALDIILLQAIIILGHAPEKDQTPMPEHWIKVE